MTRLRHSAAGFRRRLQIGAAGVVLIVEGKSDRYFYSRLFGNYTHARGIQTAIRIGRELPGNTAGGKRALLQYFEYLRRLRSLCSELAGKKTLVVFILDKDLDDRTRKLRRSKHILYTEWYEYENYLFCEGDLVQAGAAAAGLDVMSVAAVIPDQEAWLRRARVEWKDWTKICVFSVTRKIHQGDYGMRSSPVHHPQHGGVNAAALAGRIQQLQSAYGRKPESFRRVWRSVSRLVDGLYATFREDEVFKGKWYATFLADDLGTAAAGRDANLDSLEKRLLHHLAMTIDYEAAWSSTLRQRLDTVIRDCGI